MVSFGIASYGLAAIVYGAIAAITLASNPGGRRATWLTSAAAVSMVWAGGITVLLLSAQQPLAALVGLDALHTWAWTACVLSWLGSPVMQPRSSTGRWLLGSSGFVALAAILGPLSVELLPYPTGNRMAYAGLLCMALIGLFALEQVYRNVAPSQRKQLSLFALATGGIFVTDLFVYSQALLLDGLIPGFWEGRGVANAALGPVVVFALKRQSEWERELFVSRQVVFYTASLLGVGIYLFAMGVVAYVIRAIGGQWSLLLEFLFLAAAFALLVSMLFSSGIKARLRVFLVKHFYRNKYDYREEWLRLTQALGRGGDLRTLAASGLEGLARIVGSKQGELWLVREENRYEWFVAFGVSQASKLVYDRAHPLVEFLASRSWVIDSEEYASEPGRYGRSFGEGSENVLPKNSLIVPLDCQGYLQGFVVLGKPIPKQKLNFEDHDILKTAGRQVAIVLAQALAQEKLSETRQFEAMNKLSAFLMHDLKNIVAQQELVVSNAQRFGHRPEFFQDAVATIRASVERMKKVLAQLKNATTGIRERERVDVSKVLMEVRSGCADRYPIPDIELNSPAVWVAMDREKLVSVLTHVVRNAQDATPPNGRIVIELERRGDHLLISVTDTGCGMDQAFVRDRLFRPFDSTKGAKGMGIGAYQVRDTVRAAGGDVDVDSKPGVGTTFKIRLPVAGGSGLMVDQPAA